MGGGSVSRACPICLNRQRSLIELPAIVLRWPCAQAYPQSEDENENITRLCSVGYAFLYTRGIYPGITRTRQVLWVLYDFHTLPERFCDFCTTFIPLPKISVTSVTTSYRYPGMGYAFHTRNRGSSVTSVQHYTLPDKFCDFCTTFIPLPKSSVTSVTNLIPYKKYPYLTEHNLEVRS